MSKTELARKAEVSPLTIARVEVGKKCRMETKRKIIFALGFRLEDKEKVFGNEGLGFPETIEVKKGEFGRKTRAMGVSASRKAKVKKSGQPRISGEAHDRGKKRS